MHNLDEIIEATGILAILVATLVKLIVMYKTTQRWNGVGRALRNEKFVYLILWLWLLFKPFSDTLDRIWILGAIATLVTIVEVRTIFTFLDPDIYITHPSKEHINGTSTQKETHAPFEP